MDKRKLTASVDGSTVRKKAEGKAEKKNQHESGSEILNG